MATPSLSLVESLVGAIPVEVGAALIARVGERATITAKSGSIEVGSVALTVEAMDDLITQVLPPDQLESLQENGTVHFEFTPPVIGGEFAVLAASTPGDRWLEIRRRSTVIGPPAPAVAAAVRPATAPAPTALPALTVADDADVAELLSRFQAPEAAAAVPTTLTPPAAPEAPMPQRPVHAPAPAVNYDFDLSATVPTNELLPEPPPAPAAQVAISNDDLTIPSNLDFPGAPSDFDLDGLTLPDALPERQPHAAFEMEAPPAEPEHPDHAQIRPETRGMAKSHFSSSSASQSPLRRRSLVMLSVVLGVVVLSAAGWFAAQRYLWAPPAAVVAPPPAPRKPVPPKAAPRNAVEAPVVASRTPAMATPLSPTGAAKTGVEAVSKKSNGGAVAAPKPAAPPAVAKANVETPTPAPTPKPNSAPTVERPSAPVTVVPHEGFAIQVAAVRERDEADRIVARLVNQGYPGYLIRGQGSAAAFYRVRVGAFKNRQEAEETAVRLERAEGVKPWIVKETP